MTLVMFESSIPFVSAGQSFWQRCPATSSNIWPLRCLMLVCAFLSPFCGMQSFCHAVSRLIAKNLLSGHFRYCSNFPWKYWCFQPCGLGDAWWLTWPTWTPTEMIIRICVCTPLNLIWVIAASFWLRKWLILVGVTLFLFWKRRTKNEPRLVAAFL